MARRAVLIYNPRAGSWRVPRLVRSVQLILEQSGFALEVRPTQGAGHATALAREAATETAESLFVFGGDGTFREAAAGLLGSDTALGMIPGGTANVLPLSLGLPLHPQDAARCLAGAAVRELDVGLCGPEPFLMLTSAGLDARVLLRINPRLKRRLGRLAFVPTTLREWWAYGYPSIELSADGRPLSGTFVAVCNVAHYGGRWQLAPHASPHDRRLDLVLFQGSGRAATLGFALDLARGRHLQRDDVRVLCVEQVTLLGLGGAGLQVDGDALPLTTPVTVRLAPERLRVLVPQ